MPSEIVLLTSDVEAEILTNVLVQARPDLSVTCVQTANELHRVCVPDDPSGSSPGERSERRLIAYCTNIIVSRDMLNHVATPAYNFHPGPPGYPGSCAASFAIYDGVGTFGVCAHEMAVTVDSGAIVAFDEFDVPDGARFTDLEMLAYKQLFTLFLRLAPDLVRSERPLDRMDTQWGNRKTSQADVDRMKDITADMSEDEIRLRWRAFG